MAHRIHAQAGAADAEEGRARQIESGPCLGTVNAEAKSPNKQKPYACSPKRSACRSSKRRGSSSSLKQSRERRHHRHKSAKRRRAKDSLKRRDRRRKHKHDKKRGSNNRSKQEERERTCRRRDRRKRHHHHETSTSSNSLSSFSSSSSSYESSSSSSSSSYLFSSSSSQGGYSSSEQSRSSRSTLATLSHSRRRRRTREDKRGRKGESTTASAICRRDEHYYATKIQSRVRGFLTMQRSLTNDDMKRVYASIVDELVDEYLSGEFIPDLLIDVLTNAKHEYDPVSEDERMAYTMLENVLNKVVSQEIERAVRGVVRVFMDDFLHQQTRRDHDPIAANVQRIVDECTARMTNEIVREALQDMVDAYLFQQQFDVLLDKYLASLVREVVVTALTEVEVEQMCTSMLDDTVDVITRELVTESLQEAETSIKRQRQREDFALVNKMMDRVLNRALARHLLQTIASNGDDAVFREQMQVYMRQKLGDVLLQRVLMYSTPEERLRQSRITRGALEIITSHALQTTIRTNFVETLDEFEAELDRKEASLGL